MLSLLLVFALAGVLWLVVAAARKMWSAAPATASPGTGLDPRLRRAMLVDDARQTRLLLEWQEELLEYVRPGERITAVAAEEKVGSRVVVVTSRRLLATDGRSDVQAYEPERISGTRIGRLPGGNAVTSVDGPGKVFRFADLSTADALALAIDRLVGGPAPAKLTAPTGPATPSASAPERPPGGTAARVSAGAVPSRDVPALLPGFYRRVLFETGMPDNPGNTVALIELVHSELYFHAALWFDMTDDPAARREFDARFSRGGPDPDRLIHLPDDMVDFLRARVPGGRAPLRDIVRELEQVLSGPDSPLHGCEASIPADLWSEPLVPPRPPRA
ncbi:hypothetical protein [Streptomyces sp. NPDC005573]|uniref:hypothetical protein n=1 Tax=Streptomyces sp. NPDC005573 TaxID=3156890 RepID=UPI0033B2BA7B